MKWKFNFQNSEPVLTENDLLEDKVVEELILKLNQPEKWLVISWKTYEFCDKKLIIEWKSEGYEKKITSPVSLVIPKRWYSKIREKLAIIENFQEASKNRFLLSYLRGEYTVQVKLEGKEKSEILNWLLNNIKEDPYYFQDDKYIVWFKTEKMAAFCKTALG